MSITKKNKAGIYGLILLCFAGFIINFFTYYPGFMSPDSLDQFTQSLRGQYISWHPPFMAFVWHLLDVFYKGPQPMLALQLFLLWCSCYLFASSIENLFGKFLIFLIFLFTPFLQNFSGNIIKDSIMALSWLLAIAILFKYSLSNSKVVLAALISALFLLFGTWMRHNAATGLLPLCFLWAWVIFFHNKQFVKWTAAIVLFAVIICGEKLFTDKVLKPAKDYPQISLYMSDLTANFMHTHKNVYPALLYENPNFDTNYIKANYDPARIDNIIWSDKKILTLDSATAHVLKTAWLQNLIESPGLYLSNRYQQFLYYTHIKKKNELQYFFPWVHPNPYHIEVNENSRLYKAYTNYMGIQRDQFYFKPLFWIILTVLLCACIPLVRDEVYKIYYRGIAISALLYMLPMFFLIVTDIDFRYLYWNCIAGTICFILLSVDLVRRIRH